MEFNMFYCGQGLWNSRPWLEKTGSDQGGVILMEQKANIIPIFIENVYCGTANILKQDMLSIGGEVAVFKFAANCKVEYGNVLIMGTIKQYKLLIKKLATQPWKLKDISRTLEILIANILANKDVQPIEVNVNSFQKYMRNSPKVIPSGDLIQDMRNLALVKYSSDNHFVVFLETTALTEPNLLQQYILAIQSKGYQVIIKIPKDLNAVFTKYFKANYISPYTGA